MHNIGEKTENSAWRILVRHLPLALILLNLSGCAGTQEQAGDLRVGGLVFRNSGDRELTDVKLTVSNNAGFISCGQIVPGGSCSTTFPVREYSAQEMSIEWRYLGQLHVRKGVVLEVDKNRKYEQPVTILVLIRQSELSDIRVVDGY